MTQPDLSTTRNQVRREAGELKAEFAGILSAETIERYIEESWESLTAAEPTVRTFLPLFVRRFARERLQALAQWEGKLTKEHPEVLFVCVHNAGRSQMAAALLDHFADGRVYVRSAGSAPADEVNPDVITAMDEIGIDVSKEFPKPMTDEIVRSSDVVITMGCGDACPIYPGKRYEDWELDDPAEADLDGVRRIRDELDARVRALLAEVAPAEAQPGPLPLRHQHQARRYAGDRGGGPGEGDRRPDGRPGGLAVGARLVGLGEGAHRERGEKQDPEPGGGGYPQRLDQRGVEDRPCGHLGAGRTVTASPSPARRRGPTRARQGAMSPRTRGRDR